jgi:hypothetical protein
MENFFLMIIIIIYFIRVLSFNETFFSVFIEYTSVIVVDDDFGRNILLVFVFVDIYT